MTKSASGKSRPIIILAIIFLLLILVYAGILIYNRMNETPEDNGVALLSVDEAKVVGISYFDRANDLSVSFTKGVDGVWTYDADKNMPLNQSNFSFMLSTVKDLHSMSTVNLTGENAEMYGLGENGNNVVITLNDGQKITFDIGNKNNSVSGYYCSVDGIDGIYIVDNYTGFYFTLNLFGHVGKSGVGADHVAQGLKYLEITSENEHFISEKLDETPADDYSNMFEWYVTYPNENPVSVHSTAFNELSSQLFGMEFLSCVYYGDVREQPNTFGFDDPAVTVSMKYTDENGKLTDTVWKFGSQDDDGNYYFTIEGTGEVYVVDDEKIQAILGADYYNFLQRFVSVVNIEYVNKVTISSPENNIDTVMTINRAADPVIFAVDAKPVEEKPFAKVYGAVIGVLSDRWIEEGEPLSTEEPIMTVKMYFNDGKVMTVEYSYYDANFYQVSVDSVVRQLVSKRDLAATIDEVQLGLQRCYESMNSVS